MPDRLTVEEIANVSGLEALRADWLDLWRRVPAATPFQSPAWLVPWWRVFDDGELMALALRAGGRLVGLAPLYILHENGIRKLLPVGIGISDFLDPLLEPAHAAAAVREIVGWLAAQAHRFDRADLEAQREGSLWLEASWPLGWQVEQHTSEPCPVLVLPEAGAPAARVLSSHRRKRLRYYFRCAERLGAARFETAARDTFPEFVEALFALHCARWGERGQPGVLADARVQAFHRDAAAALLELGRLRLHGLRVGGHLVAVLHGFADRSRLHFYISGFDPTLPHPGLGSLMIGHAIEAAAREGLREFHFLRGGERYKYDWGASDRPTYGLRLEPPRY